MGAAKSVDIYNFNKKGHIKFEIPLVPPSVNIVYKKSRSGMVYKTGVAREFEQKFKNLLSKQFKGNYCFKDRHYELTIFVYFENLLYKNGSFVKIDASNHIKIVEDCIEKFFGYDDKCNFRVIVEKRECVQKPRIVCKLRPYTKKELDKVYCKCKFNKKEKK